MYLMARMRIPIGVARTDALLPRIASRQWLEVAVAAVERAQQPARLHRPRAREDGATVADVPNLGRPRAARLVVRLLQQDERVVAVPQQHRLVVRVPELRQRRTARHGERERVHERDDDDDDDDDDERATV